MPTVNSIITTSLRHLGVLGAAESAPSAEDADICLTALKSLLDLANLNPQAVVGLTELTHTPSAGVQSFTIGPSGDVVSRQPARIVKAIYRRDSVDEPIDVVDVSEYAEMPLKSTQAVPELLALNRGYDEATVYIYPAADGQTQFRLWVEVDVVSSFDTITGVTNLTLPNGYQNWLEWKIAEEVLSVFSIPASISQRVNFKAQNAERAMKKANIRVPQLCVDGEEREFDIYSGAYR